MLGKSTGPSQQNAWQQVTSAYLVRSGIYVGGLRPAHTSAPNPPAEVSPLSAHAQHSGPVRTHQTAATVRECLIAPRMQGTPVAVDYHARSGVNSRADYERLYERSIHDPAGFWADHARQFHWDTPVGYPSPACMRLRGQFAGASAFS